MTVPVSIDVVCLVGCASGDGDAGSGGVAVLLVIVVVVVVVVVLAGVVCYMLYYVKMHRRGGRHAQDGSARFRAVLGLWR